jgi:hypothetical protein
VSVVHPRPHVRETMARRRVAHAVSAAALTVPVSVVVVQPRGRARRHCHECPI